MCTHNLNEADRLCDRIGIFKSRLIEVDTPENLRKKLFGRKVVFHLREINPQWAQPLHELEGVHEVQIMENKLVIAMDNPDILNPQIIRALVQSGADILFVGELRHSLEDIYLQTMRDTAEEEVAG
jgi:ABC-2 type transport system ATP-binding protein